jgi:hypothetical protein
VAKCPRQAIQKGIRKDVADLGGEAGIYAGAGDTENRATL